MNEYQAAINQMESDKGWCPPPLEKHYDLAIAALREKNARENPEPLNRGQLASMYGQPVWLLPEGEPEGMWDIIGHGTMELFDTSMNCMFYAHKPDWGEIPAWSAAHSFDFGHSVTSAANSGVWTYDDTGTTAPENRPCPRCGEFRGEDGIDPCLGKLPGVTAACCGHGVEDGYVMFGNGVCIRGQFVVEMPDAEA